MTAPEATYRMGTGSRTAIGSAGGYQVIADRPAGRAGGSGSGFNGGQLLALSLGGCFANDLHYVAEEMGVEITDLTLEIFIDWGGSPTVAQAIRMSVSVDLASGADPAALIAEASRRCTIANTLRAGVPLVIATA